MAEKKQGKLESSMKETIYTYKAPWPVFALGWSYKLNEDYQYRIAVGSFIEEYKNKVEILQYDSHKDKYVAKGSFDHPYPCTKVMWIPDPNFNENDLLATTGDYLRLWKINSEQGVNSVKVEQLGLLNRNKDSEFCAPLTSFDWNAVEQSIIGTASTDTTCTIWDVNTQQAKTQIIAHDDEVFDIAFSKEKNVFASVGAEGSLRLFDLRKLDRSTIMYETAKRNPLLRLAWNMHDPFYLGTILRDSPKTLILDIRQPKSPVMVELKGHTAAVNAIAFAPHSASHICTAGDDTQALIWHLTKMGDEMDDPILAYAADSYINQLQWNSASPDWIAIGYDEFVQFLRV